MGASSSGREQQPLGKSVEAAPALPEAQQHGLGKSAQAAPPLHLELELPRAGSRRSASSLAEHHEGRSSWITASGHLITVMVGAGVLALPAAMSVLGWVGGCVCLVVFFGISLMCSLMLAAVYKVRGRRHATYKDAVFFILGPRYGAALAVVQHSMLLLAAIGYEIAAADAMTYLLEHDTHGTAAGAAPPAALHWRMTLVFGGIQVLLSLLPDLESVWFVSYIGAAMSIAYSVLTIGLGASQARNGRGSLWGKPAPPMERVFSVFNALGQMVFAYGCAIVSLEVQDTLREPPDALASMRRALKFSMSTAFLLYVAVAVLCYAALGSDVHGSVLLNFSDAAPWATLLGNAFVLVHMFSAFQVFCQPVFATLERWLVAAVPRVDSWAGEGRKRVHAIRLCYRGLYVGLVTLVALFFPFFGAFVGLIGAIAFWPLAVFMPIQMFCAVRPPQRRGARAGLACLNGAMALVSLGAAVGSIADIVSAASHFNVGAFR